MALAVIVLQDLDETHIDIRVTFEPIVKKEESNGAQQLALDMLDFASNHSEETILKDIQ